MLKNNFFLFIALLCFSSILTPFFKQIRSFNEARKVLEAADSDTFVLFDIDETLIGPLDKIHRSQGYSSPLGDRLTRDFEIKAGEKAQDLWNIVSLESKSILIEPAVAIIIKDLQARGIKANALTLAKVGRYGRIESFEEYRFEQLKALGIDFQKSFTGSVTFNQFASHLNSYPIFYKGILLTNGHEKGPVLGAFLDHYSYKPKTIIFFDDLHSNLLSVEKELKNRGITFHGYHYHGYSYMNGELDPLIVQFQFEFLLRYHRWLSEDEAEEMLTASSLHSQVTV